MIREEPYPGSNVGRTILKGMGQQWRPTRCCMVVVSSCREVSAYAHNERNPRVQLPASRVGHSGRTAGASREEARDDVKSARPLRPGRHTCYNGVEQREATWRQGAEPENTSQFGLSLQLDSMKLDSLVIAHQPWRGEYVPGPCTHRPSSHGSRECLKAVTARSGQG